MIIAFAGRRIDESGAKPERFPPRSKERVREALKEVFHELKAQVIVSSAACGADLLALEVAEELHVRRRVVLPCEIAEFRRTSVTDRNGGWGGIFDRIIGNAISRGDLLILQRLEGGDNIYLEANRVILQEAQILLRDGGRVDGVGTAVIAWDGVRKDKGNDMTDAFAKSARELGMHIMEVSTL
jgi:hypothetical protein